MNDSLWVLLLDTSGSMGEPFQGGYSFQGISEQTTAPTKIAAAKDTLLKKIKGIAHSDIAIVEFKEVAQTLFHGMASDPILASKIQALTAGGGTDIGNALMHAGHEFAKSATYKTVIFLLITDGLSDVAPAKAAAIDIAAKRVLISGILIDPSIEGEKLMQEITIGGDCQSVGSSEELRHAVTIAERRVPDAMALPHQEAARSLHILVISIFGLLAGACVSGGIYAIYRNALSPSEFSLLGARLSTGHVGVAFIGVGLVIAYATVKSVLRNQLDLAALPLDGYRRPQRRRKKRR